MPKDAPFCSIITVTLHNFDGLKRTYASLKHDENHEWIVVDGGSNDGTQDFLSITHAKWSSAPDKGIYDAMNKGLKRARGEYVLFLNAGDTLAARNILDDIRIDTKGKPDFIYGDAYEALENGAQTYKPARALKTPPLTMFTHHQAMLYKRSALNNLQYNLNYKIAADYGFTASFLKHCQTLHYFKRPICVFESGGISQQNVKMGRTEQFKIREELGLKNPVMNRFIFATQSALWFLRTHLPNLYWPLKSWRNIARGASQNGTPARHPKTPA